MSMTDVSCYGRQPPLHIFPSAIAAEERPDNPGVPQIVNARASPVGGAPKANPMREAHEGPSHRTVG